MTSSETLKVLKSRPLWPANMMGKYLAAGLLVSVLAIIDLIWMAEIGRLHVEGLQQWASVLSSTITPALLLASVAHIPRYRVTARKLFYGEVTWFLSWIVLFAISTVVLAIFTYLCTSVSGALIDRQLMAFDSSVGFDWPSARRWLGEHPLAKSILSFSYHSFILQLAVITLALVFMDKQDDLYAFFLFFVISAVSCSIVSVYLPANSLFTVYDVGGAEAASVSHFVSLRNKSDLSIRLTDIQGLISFPSFHTMLAVGFVYAVRNVPALFGPFLILNGLMILSTPSEGGHYLLDVAAGAVLAFVVIWLIEQGRSAHRTGASQSI